MRGGRLLLPVVALAALLTSGPVVADARRPGAPEPQRLSEPDARPMPRLPLQFEENLGQVDQRVTHLVRAGGYIAYFTAEETVFALHSGGPSIDDVFPDDEPFDVDVVRMRFEGASRPQAAESMQPRESRSHYFIGDDPNGWERDVRHFGSLAVREVYPGIDVRWRSGAESRLTYDLEVAPGADPDDIVMRFGGAASVAIDSDGALLVTTPNGEMRHSAPVVFQDLPAGRRFVDGRFDAREDGSIGFRVGDHDRRRRLVIDPGIAYSTFVGTAANDRTYDLEVASTGHLVTCGYTASASFPTSSAYQSTAAGGSEAFVMKLSSDGSALVYSTYVGGSGNDYGNSIALGASDELCVAGHCNSTNFPTNSAYQSSLGGDYDAFVLELSASGSTLTRSTYLGGSLRDRGISIGVTSAGTIVAGGMTQSSNFPTSSAIQSSHGGGTWDGWVTQLASTGSSLTYSTYLGGSGDDMAFGRMVVAGNDVFVTGGTTSSDYPTTSGAAQTSSGGGSYDAVLTKISSSGSALAYSTYLGGSGDDVGVNVAVDSSGNAYVVGHTTSSDFPTTTGVLSTSRSGNKDAFVTKVNASGSGWSYSTYVGGSGDEFPGATDTPQAGIAVDSQGNAYAVGWTDSTDFPMVAAFQSSFGGGSDDAFVLRLSSDGAELDYSSYLGGSGVERPYHTRVNSDGSSWVAGWTTSTDFPTVSALYGSHSGNEDGFITKLAAPVPPSAPLNPTATATDDRTVVVTWLDISDYESGFEVGRSTEGGAFVQVAEVDADAQSHTDESADGETEFRYRVRAVNAFGASEYATADALWTPPWRPDELTAETVSDTEIDLSWTDESDAEARFRIEFRDLNDAGYAYAGTVGADVTTFSHALLEPETTYVYRVRAENDDGGSSWDASDQVTTAPGAPSSRNPQSNPDATVTITWQDESESETGFEVQRGLGCPGSDFVTLAIVAADSESYVDDTIEPETTYSYRIRAVRDDVASNWGPHICLTTPPYAPADVVAESISPSRVRVRWTDRASAEDAFLVRRRELPDGIFTTIATVDADSTGFDDTEAGPDTEYLYGLRARNENGDSAEVLCDPVVTPSILVLSKAKVKRGKTTKKGTKPSRLQLAGTFDIGDRGFHLGGPMTLRIGDTDVEIRSLGAKRKGYRHDGPGLRVDLKPFKGSVGRVALKVTLEGAAADQLDPDGELLVGYEREDFRAVGAARMTSDRFEAGKGRGHQIEPRLGISSLSAKLKSGATDTLKIRGSFDPSGGIPEELTDGTIDIGLLRLRVPADQFSEKRGKLLFSQRIVGSRKVTLDYAKGSFSVTLRSVELGEFADGEHAVPVEISFGELRFRSTLQMTSTGKALRY